MPLTPLQYSLYSVAIEPLPGQHLDIAFETLSPRVGWSLPMIIRATTTWGNMLNPRVIIWNSRLSPGFSWNWETICHVLWYITLWPPILVFLFKNLSILLFLFFDFFFPGSFLGFTSEPLRAVLSRSTLKSPDSREPGTRALKGPSPPRRSFTQWEYELGSRRKVFILF